MQRLGMQLYTMLACFAILVYGLVLAGNVLRNTVTFILPQFTLSSYQYACHLNDESFKDCYIKQKDRASQQAYIPEDQIIDQINVQSEIPIGEALTKKRLASLEVKTKQAKYENSRSILMDLANLFIALTLFWIHWRLLRKLKTEQLNAP